MCCFRTVLSLCGFIMFRLTLALYIACAFFLLWISIICWQNGWYATSILTLGIGCVVVWSAIRFAEKSVLSIGQFIEALTYHDFQQMPVRLPEGQLFSGIRSAMEEVRNTLQTIRWEHEEHYHTLQEVLRSINTGIIAIDTTQARNILWCSPPAERLLRSLNDMILPPLHTFQDIYNLHTHLAETANALAVGSSTLFTLHIDSSFAITAPQQARQFIIQKSSYYKEGREIILLLIHEATNALDAKELEAWHQLSRILTHEIMNSLAPISSLAQTAEQIIQALVTNRDIHPLQQNEDLRDALLALQTIARRSAGLSQFIENYRSVTRIPQPQKSTLVVATLFEHVSSLCIPRVRDIAPDITLVTRVHSQEQEAMTFSVDAGMLEQVLINLILNSADALRTSGEEKVITVSALYTAPLSPFYDHTQSQLPARHIEITVHDTGSGIAPSAMAHIFLPFFTTKPHGSGIGLSLSRQIIRAHGGTLTVVSTPHNGTTFRIVLPVE